VTSSTVHTVVRLTDGAVVLTLTGTLDSRSYLTLRDAIIKAAIDGPSAVIADMTGLHVPADSALAVFTSARWHIDRWPSVPLLLACLHDKGRDSLRRNGITRYVPVYRTVTEALSAIPDSCRPIAEERRRRERAVLPADPNSIALARELVTRWLTDWSACDLLAAAKIVASVLVDNALRYSEGSPVLRLEIMGDRVTVAVEDNSTAPAEIREDGYGPRQLSGLKIVDAVCSAWGCNPTPTGKAVWGVVAPDDPTAGR
jgi:hypothetical protein